MTSPRSLAAAAAVLGLVLSVAGCAASPVGRAGIGLDGGGRPVSYLEVCSDHIDGVTLVDTEHPDEILGRWRSVTPVMRSTSWSMTDPVGDWTVVDPLVDLQPGVTYRVSGWTDDEAFLASGVEFTVDDLGDKNPGEVWFDGGVGEPDVFRTYTCAT